MNNELAFAPHHEIIAWIDEQLKDNSMMRDKRGDAYFDRQDYMLRAIKGRIIRYKQIQDETPLEDLLP